MSRTYVVLRGNGAAWEPVDTVDATGSEQAIRAAVATDGSAGSYVAVPEHNWNQVAVTVEQPTPRIRLQKERKP